MFNYILFAVVVLHYNHCFNRIMHYRKNDIMFNINNDLMNLLDKPIFPQIIFVPREMDPFEMEHMAFFLNII